MIMCYVKQIMTWGLRMEFSTDNLKSMAQQLALDSTPKCNRLLEEYLKR